MVKWAFYVLVLCVVAVYSKVKLPDYLSQCKWSDPELNSCFVKNANLGIPKVVHGDKKVKIPNLLPLRINEVAIVPSDTFKIVLSDVDVYGFDKATVKSANIDTKQDKLDLKIAIPNVQLIGKYETKGRILILPIEGNGPSNFTIVDGIYNYKIDIERYQKDGDEYAKIKSSELIYDPQHIYFKLENLFNGNEQLGSEMNKFLNENWKEVSTELNPAIQETIATIINSIINGILTNVPFNEIFPA